MTYTEWRDELKNNLLSVSESERRRVLDYYAEAYADRREAGFTEREIIEDFGAPYDAAQRILCDFGDCSDDIYSDGDRRRDSDDPQIRGRKNDRGKDGRERRRESETEEESEAHGDEKENVKKERDGDKKTEKDSEGNAGNRFMYALLCVIFCIPFFMLLMGMVGITISFCVAPFAVLISGAAIAGGGIGAMVGGEVLSGLCSMGAGIIVFGVGIILVSLFTKFVKLLWKLWNSFFKWIKSLFGIKEKEKVK